jgi:predicted metalloenzyme YecM
MQEDKLLTTQITSIKDLTTSLQIQTTQQRLTHFLIKRAPKQQARYKQRTKLRSSYSPNS